MHKLSQNIRQETQDEIKGVVLGYAKLKEQFGDAELTPIVVGGIIPSSNILAFLKLP